MRVLITGASGFIGAALAARLLSQASALGSPVTRLLLADLRVAKFEGNELVECHEGDIADGRFLDELLATEPDVIYHLASVPGGAAERDPQTGSPANLHATIRLFEGLRNATKPPIVIFASTVAVYGIALPKVVGPDTLPRPVTSYGTHKLMTEFMLSDLSRRGEIDGRCVRFPGIVARPAQPSGHVSAFMSNIFHAMREGRPFVSPVSAGATCWWMSARRCVDNLIHAARLDGAGLGTTRVWPLPVLRLSMGDLVTALAQAYGADRQGLVTYEPVDSVEITFGQYPVLDDRAARALGFRDDESVTQLIRNAMAA